MKFGMRTYLVHTFGVIEAIFDIPTLSRVTGVGHFHPQGVFPQYLGSGVEIQKSPR